jgi:hypothetical protein
MRLRLLSAPAAIAVLSIPLALAACSGSSPSQTNILTDGSTGADDGATSGGGTDAGNADTGAASDGGGPATGDDAAGGADGEGGSDSTAQEAGIEAGGPDSSGGTDAGLSDASGGDANDAGALTILTLSSSAPSMTQGASVTVTAVVVDAAGAAAIKGGTLTNPAGTATYGTFAVSTTPGTFTFTLTWTGINALSPINFVGKTSLDFLATFSDTLGHSQSKTLAVDLTCGSGVSPNGACAGACIDLTVSPNCGACGSVCTSGSTCSAIGKCEFPTTIYAGIMDPSSLDLVPTPGGLTLTCTAACGAAQPGATCVSAVATLFDGAPAGIGCDTSAVKYVATKTVLVTVTDAQCACNDGDLVGYVKDKVGSCASTCTAKGQKGCWHTIFSTNAPNAAAFNYDTCSAPYAFDDWDNVALPAVRDADGGITGQVPASLTLNDSPISIDCNCAMPASP